MSKALTLEAIAKALYKLRNAWLPGGATYDTAIAALEVVKRLRESHKPYSYVGHEWCEVCETVWPCPTIAAIDGEEKS
jgi:hypothetical protein